MTVFWPALIGGALLIPGGIALIRHREEVARFNADLQRQTFGDGAAAEQVQRASTPRNVAIPGVFALVMGAALVVASFLGLDW